MPVVDASVVGAWSAVNGGRSQAVRVARRLTHAWGGECDAQLHRTRDKVRRIQGESEQTGGRSTGDDTRHQRGGTRAYEFTRASMDRAGSDCDDGEGTIANRPNERCVSPSSRAHRIDTADAALACDDRRGGRWSSAHRLVALVASWMAASWRVQPISHPLTFVSIVNDAMPATE
jgi:hypothetical protein